MKIPYVNIAAQHAPIKPELLQAVERVLDHGQLVLGLEVGEFECRLAALCGAKYAVGVNSGTDALVLVLQALGIGRGDEVILPPNSFVATAACIMLAGARPVLVDVRDDYNIDPDLIERAVTPRTKAIIPVHLTGRPADMTAILAVARAHNLHVIEDAAQTIAAEYKGRRVGSFGIAGCFSLHPLKTLNACGDGGAITTDDEGLYGQLKIRRNLGLRTRDDCVVWSGNSRLDTPQAALLMVKLNSLETWTDKRRANARFYQQRLSGVVTLPVDQPHERSVYHTFVVQADRRDELKKPLADRGVGAGIHYPVPIHLRRSAQGLGYGPGSFPVAEQQARRILSLPVYPELTSEELEHVAHSLVSFYRRAGEG